MFWSEPNQVRGKKIHEYRLNTRNRHQSANIIIIRQTEVCISTHITTWDHVIELPYLGNPGDNSWAISMKTEQTLFKYEVEWDATESWKNRTSSLSCSPSNLFSIFSLVFVCPLCCLLVALVWISFLWRWPPMTNVVATKHSSDDLVSSAECSSDDEDLEECETSHAGGLG